MIEDGNYDKYLYLSGTKVYPYYSDIDGRYNQYRVCIPKNFRKENKYALLINNMINPYPEKCTLTILKEPMLFKI